MDQKDITDLKDMHLEKYIPIIGTHLSGWKDVKTEEDAIIFRLSGLSNITCMVKAKSKSVSPRYVIFRVFDNELCSNELESAVFDCLSDQGLGPVCYFQNSHYRIEQSYDARPITIFEMRNPVLLKKIIEKTFKLNYNQKLKQTLIDLQENHGHTQVETLINDWLPKVTAKYDHYYSLLTVDQYKEDLEWFKKEYLRDDVVEYLKGITYGLIEEGPPEDSLKNYVVCHNDIQECNILSMRHHSSDLAIIDYEYASLGNREFDLANTFCEMIEDNAYPYFPYIALYLENCPTQEEFEEYSKYYLELYHETFGAPEETKEEYVARELPQFLENLYCCMVFDGYFWGIWSILMIEEDKINDKIFNFSLGVLRMKITHHLLTLDFVKEAVDNKIRKYKASQE
ncbi:unnamed protein product [Moneuplotes crassus]|uniref:Choline/ethanolamine kinase n=1 Tax=Euplotes crassus TaxID=5936 RepID=A0AAD1UMB2_EUPCR|nr:unnamed protein product [Moneuplotes crassus]